MISLSEAEKISILALVHTPSVGAVTVRQLISYCGGAENVFRSEYKKLIKIPGVGDKVARSILNGSGLSFAEDEFRTCGSSGTSLHFFNDATYPARLKPLYDAPIVLYSRGNFDFNAYRSVGIVGTRQISDYGKMVTEMIIKDLLPFSPLIVSGLAYGVDIVAHRACIKHQIPTIGVMASGLDVIYPAAHLKTAKEMQQNGGIVTENALATKPDFMRFPARNRIIAGLSDVTIVVESAKKGGSLITADFAGNYHRDVFAVPGKIESPHSEGCNQLIRDNKAAIFTSVEDMTTALGWGTADEQSNKVVALKPELNLSFDGFTQDEGQVLSLLKQKGSMQIDEISWQSGMNLNKLAALLLNLEFQGMIRSMPGKKYSLI
ncbi:MAG TPA: DNA-processing protein DprA [Dyadobacter sp.]|jgi:DNA processing protein|nr:DNA-processing protein DprA [Dyadobacter sp.]